VKEAKSTGNDADARSVLSSRPLMRSSKDRFDLKGRKVVQRQSSITDIEAALKENSMFQDWKLSNSAYTSIATVCVDSMLNAGFAVEHTPLQGESSDSLMLHHTHITHMRHIKYCTANHLNAQPNILFNHSMRCFLDSQPQDELLNHQLDSDEPGYNMTEICEVR
jgi:hypothetical protein